MNGYERRRQERLQAQAARREKEREESFISMDQAVRAYELAFKGIYGYLPKIQMRQVWISVNGKSIRKSRLIEMTRQLLARVHEQELNTPEQSL